MAMTRRRQVFIHEYLIDLNGSQAAIRAGYSAKCARQQAERLLRDPEVKLALDEAMQQRAEKIGINSEHVLRELMRLGFANMQDYMRPGPDGDPYLDFSAITRDQAAALVEVTVEDFKDKRTADGRDVRRIKFKLADKLGALNKIGEHIGMFPKKHEFTGKGGGPIETVARNELDLSKLNTTELDELERILANARAGAAGDRGTKPGSVH
ncbi:MAG: terminase small subunit [Alphaproteobacteria bacterium]